MTGFESLIDKLDIFRKLNDEEKSEVAEMLDWKNYAQGEYVVTHKDDSNDVYFLGCGRVRATIFSKAGREVSYPDLYTGQMFGELAAIDRQGRTTHVVVLEDATIASMNAAVFWDVLRRYPTVAEATLKRLAELARVLLGRIYEFGALDVRQRVCMELLRLAKEYAQKKHSNHRKHAYPQRDR